MALRPRASPSSMASRCTAHALADDCGGAVFTAGATPKSVVTSMAGFAGGGSLPITVSAPAGIGPVVTSASGGASREAAGVANSAPKSVVTPMAVFARSGPPSAPMAVTASLAGFADPRPHKPGGRRPTPASPVSYTHLRAHETRHDLVCRL